VEWIRPKVRALASLPGCLATHTKPLELTPADGNGGEELFQGSYNTRLRPLCSERSDVTVSDLAAAWVRLEEAERASNCSAAAALWCRRLHEERTYRCC